MVSAMYESGSFFVRDSGQDSSIQLAEICLATRDLGVTNRNVNPNQQPSCVEIDYHFFDPASEPVTGEHSVPKTVMTDRRDHGINHRTSQLPTQPTDKRPSANRQSARRETQRMTMSDQPVMLRDQHIADT